MSKYTLLNGTYGLNEIRQLIVNYIRGFQSMFEDHFDRDLNDY